MIAFFIHNTILVLNKHTSEIFKKKIAQFYQRKIIFSTGFRNKFCKQIYVRSNAVADNTEHSVVT